MALDVAKAFNSDQFSDVLLRCDGRQWFGHGMIICTYSPYFEHAYLTTLNLSEPMGRIPTRKKIVQLTECDASTLHRVLQFCYTQDYEDEDDKTNLPPVATTAPAPLMIEAAPPVNGHAPAGSNTESSDLLGDMTPSEQLGISQTSISLDLQHLHSDSTHFNSPALSRLWNNLRVYLAAHQFNIASLSDYAAKKIGKDISSVWKEEGFAVLVALIFSRYTTVDTTLHLPRYLIAEQCALHITKLMQKPAFADILKNKAKVGYAVIEQLVKKYNLENLGVEDFQVTCEEFQASEDAPTPVATSSHSASEDVLAELASLRDEVKTLKEEHHAYQVRTKKEVKELIAMKDKRITDMKYELQDQDRYIHDLKFGLAEKVKLQKRLEVALELINKNVPGRKSDNTLLKDLYESKELIKTLQERPIEGRADKLEKRLAEMEIDRQNEKAQIELLQKRNTQLTKELEEKAEASSAVDAAAVNEKKYKQNIARLESIISEKDTVIAGIEEAKKKQGTCTTNVNAIATARENTRVNTAPTSSNTNVNVKGVAASEASASRHSSLVSRAFSASPAPTVPRSGAPTFFEKMQTAMRQATAGLSTASQSSVTSPSTTAAAPAAVAPIQPHTPSELAHIRGDTLNRLPVGPANARALGGPATAHLPSIPGNAYANTGGPSASDLTQGSMIVENAKLKRQVDFLNKQLSDLRMAPTGQSTPRYVGDAARVREVYNMALRKLQLDYKACNECMMGFNVAFAGAPFDANDDRLILKCSCCNAEAARWSLQ